MSIRITDFVEQEILRYAREAMEADDTREAVGALVAFPSEPRVMAAAWLLTNVAEHAHARYEVDDAELLELHNRAHRQHARVVGYWHSHLRGGPDPSDGDLRLAPPEPDLHVIVAMRPAGHSGPLMRAWRIRDQHAEAEPIDWL